MKSKKIDGKINEITLSVVFVVSIFQSAFLNISSVRNITQHVQVVRQVTALGTQMILLLVFLHLVNHHH